MFLKLYWLGAALTLMSLPTQLQGQDQQKYFPYILRDITNTTFPFNLNVTTNSDTVHVKCPNAKYNHKTPNDSFVPNVDIFQEKSIYSNPLNKFAWVPLLRQSNNQALITCGKIYIENVQGPEIKEQWIYKVMWENATNVEGFLKREQRTKDVSDKHQKCSTTANKIIIFGSKKEGGYSRIPNPEIVPDLYVNQMLYYFVKPDDDEMKKEPCGIIKIFGKEPKIKLLKHEPTPDSPQTDDIYIVKTDEKTIDVVLDMKGNLKYYQGEKIILKKMKYRERGAKVIEGSDTLISSNFTINGYDIIELIYNIPSEETYNNISKKYYFAPSLKEHIINEGTIKYFQNETYKNPNCPLFYLNIGYLNKFKYNVTEKDYNNSVHVDSIKEISSKTDSHIFFNGAEDPHLTISCFYKTLNGNITTTTEFVDLDKLDLIEKMKEEETMEKFRKINETAELKIIESTKNFDKTMKEKEKKMQEEKKKAEKKLDETNKAIKDKKYLSMKMLVPTFLKAMKTDDEVDIVISDLFDETLVNCHKNLPRKIQAHYVYTDAEERRYILSDGPTIHNQSSFWQMIYEEDIATIIAIIYDKRSEDNDEAINDLYWKTDKRAYGDITVAHYKKIEVNVLSVTGYQLLLERKGYESKNLKIFHAFNWKENDIPQSDLQFFSIYQEIIKVAPKKNILIHSSQGTGARVYMLTYFACIYDALKSNDDVNCPLEVIKDIRNRRYGGNLVPYEFAYLIKALVTAFFNNKILVDFSQRRTDFISNYDSYFYDYLKRKEQMSDELKEFLNFVNIVDKGKIYEYKSVFYNLGRIDPKTLPNCCQRFQKAIDNFQNGKDVKKCRYKNIQCLDSSRVTVNGKPDTDKDSFIHANKFEYTTKNNKTRKMILCQAPLVDTIDDMLDMILRYKITVIVILVKPEEATGPEKKWIPYFPEQDQAFETLNFTVSKVKFKKVDANSIAETTYDLMSKKGLGKMNFTILHYQGVPSEHKSIYSLYKRIISLRTDDYVAIHCSAGIGRTGALALIIYLIDTINYFPNFDPIARLKCLREHRYLAIQGFNQFVFALMVVFEHYKKEINDMDSEAYDKFLAIAENVFKKEK
uniref:Tyrosine-protein phosphatase domain-containing protein n=1 Tax=Strongyloides papillosus TaxID=174720 RepID=A0A0N5C6C9_STREA